MSADQNVPKRGIKSAKKKSRSEVEDDDGSSISNSVKQLPKA